MVYGMLYNMLHDMFERFAPGLIPTNLFSNSLLSLFCPALEANKNNQVFTKLVVW